MTFMVEKDEVDCHGSHMAEREARGLDPCESVIPVPFPPCPLPCFHHDNHQNIVVDFIDDPVETLANPIPLLAGKLLTTRRMRVIHQFIKALDDTNDIFSGD